MARKARSRGQAIVGGKWDAMVEWCIRGLNKSRRVPFKLDNKPSIFTAGNFMAHGIDVDGTVMWSQPFKNGTTLVGLNDVLEVYLGGGTQSLLWYMGLIDADGFSALSSSDSMSSHTGWTENADYDEATRPAWTPAAAAGQAITNTSSVDFTIDGNPDIQGAFIVNNSTISGTTGILWATGEFSSVQSLTTGQVLKVTYTCTASAG